MSKKRLLFVIESLNSAGAEKSLITLLSVLDYSRYEVDLQLFSYGGAFQRYLPPEVHLLPAFNYTDFAEKSVWEQIASADFRKLRARSAYSILMRLHRTTHADKARIFWKHVSPCLPGNLVEYDAAIAYSQGLPTFYVAEKVKARRKMAWVNVGYKLEGKNALFQEPFYQQMDHIVAVSTSALSIFQEVFPKSSDKMTVIWDMLDAKTIRNMASEKPPFPFSQDIPSLLTIARLNSAQKGYDIALEACRILRDRGVPFKWYALGEGPYRKEMETFIRENRLEDSFVLLGTTPNPYPYIDACTLYVQTSRHEGFGLAIAEARILNKPVVTTEFDAVYNQMRPGKNGLVVSQTPVAVADAIERLLKDKQLYASLVDNLQKEKKGNTEEIEKLYRLIEYTE
ncbi:glycosyltransferase [Bacteroides sp. AN502(2024)]|uniref:glycosyltransferase n=1 Tax=Bacteroides sp. AN502(2024) TaxID=3160599 RepID=UPI003513DE5C